MKNVIYIQADQQYMVGDSICGVDGYGYRRPIGDGPWVAVRIPWCLVKGFWDDYLYFKYIDEVIISKIVTLKDGRVFYVGRPKMMYIPKHLRAYITGSSWTWDISILDVKDAIRRFGYRGAEIVLRAFKEMMDKHGEEFVTPEDFIFSSGAHIGDSIGEIIWKMSPRIVWHRSVSVYDWIHLYVKTNRRLIYLQWKDQLRVLRLSFPWSAIAVYVTVEDQRSEVDWEHIRRLIAGKEPLPSYIPKYMRRLAAWRINFGRVPKRPEVRRISMELIPALKKKFKIFLKGLRQNPEADQHWVEAWARLVVAFGDRALQIPVEKVHDMGINLQSWLYSKELCNWLWKHRASQRWSDLVRIANNWEALKEMGASLSMPIKDLAALLASLQYENVRHVHFAHECAKWGVSQRYFEVWQDRWLKGLLNLKYESIPRVDFSEGDYRFYRLQKDDPRGLFLGEYTDCCQHPRGVGESCAWHGHESPNGAFFVVEYRGQIVAQSWAWRHGGVLVFDNIEVLGADKERDNKVLELYKRAAKLLLGCLGITEVRVGCRYTDVDLSDLPDVNPVPTPEGVYTDASQQKLLARVE